MRPPARIVKLWGEIFTQAGMMHGWLRSAQMEAASLRSDEGTAKKSSIDTKTFPVWLKIIFLLVK
jgi:hypothetical protein